ncbi:hypothetical protein Aduo_017309 [Ancylostoma duodenale]
MEPGALLPRNNFSSIARRLLLSGESRPASQMPTTSHGVHPTTFMMHGHEVNAIDLIPCALSEQQLQVELERHTCDLCDRLRGITAEMLRAPKAPVEKPYKSIKGRGRSITGPKGKPTRSNIGWKGKAIIKHSSIARRLLLNQESSPNLQLPTTSHGDVYHNVSYGVKVEDDEPSVSHRRHVNAPDMISRTLLEIHQQNERAKHTCDLCARSRGITTEMLTAPLEKSGRVRRPSLGRKAKVTVTRVRQFFDLLKLQMGESCQGTLFNSPAVLTSLACGVSRVTVTRTSMELSRLSYCNGKGMSTLKKYDQEWSAVVRDFVNSMLEEDGLVALTDLHSRLSFAYADFPMCVTTLHYFLTALGFLSKEDGDQIYIVPDNRSDTESEYESEEEGEEM